MNKTRSLVNSLLVCGVTLVLGSNLGAQTTNRTAKVVRVEGTARYSINNGADWSFLTVGTVLKEGTLLQTGTRENSYIDLVLGEGRSVTMATPGAGGGKNGSGGSAHQHPSNVDVVRLYKDTVLGLDKLSANPTGAGVQTETQLDLRKGHITGNVKKMVAGSNYEIRYPKGVAGIRGSVYDMSLVEGINNGTVTVTLVLDMLTGSAVVSFYPSGSTTPITQTVLPGFGFDTGTDALTPLSPAQVSELSQILASMGVTTTVAVTVVAGNNTTIEQVTTTTGQQAPSTAGQQTGGSTVQ